MKVYSANEIRNVAVLGHSGSGKTTLMEAAASLGGLTKRVGRVEDGNTVSDYDPEEIRRRVSISASMVPIEWKDTKINFIDTPGYFDFVGEVHEALRAADLALILVSAKSGIEVGTEKAVEMADALGIPKMIFVNNMDDENADIDKVVDALKEKFGKSIAPLQVPFKENGKFVGFVDAIRKEGRRYVDGKTTDCEIPADIKDAVDAMHSMIEEAIAETSDDLMEKFFAEEPFAIEEIEKGIRDGIKDGSVTPVMCGSALMNIGPKVMMSYIVSFTPSAAQLCPEVKATDVKTGDEITLKCDENQPFAAFVWKTIADPYVGRLNLFRLYAGKITKDTPLYNPNEDAVEKPSRLYIMRGKEQIEVEELRAGDIGAIAKLTVTGTQHTLCAKERPVSLTRIEFPPSLYSMAILPKGKGDEDKIAGALQKIREEDKTFRYNVDPETKESVISGIGDSHLDVVVNKLKAKYKLDVDLMTPVVPYRETLKSKIRVQGKHKKQSGGHGQYGDVHIEFEPSGDITAPVVFEEKVFGGAVPKGYFPAVEKGLQECCKSGPLAGYPVIGLKATLVDGSYHDVDSSEMAFKLATSIAFKEAFAKGKSAILEPIGKAEITVPDSYTGDVMGDMNKRRGRILGINKVGDKQVVSAEVPMSEMFKYAIDLRSMTQGRGSFTLEFDRYEDAPGDVSQKVIAEHGK